MPSVFLRRCFYSIVVLCGLPSVVLAQTAAGDMARGQGAYLNGAGWYNLNTAKANAVNTDAAIRWKQDLRKIQSEKRDLEARTAAGKKLREEEVKQRQQERERQLRVAPTGADVQTGEALNVLLYDLTDPAITTESWQSKSVALPEMMSVKDLIFRFTPLSSSSKSSAALSKGVIALSRLAVTGKAWPTPLQLPEVERERLEYEKAYAKLSEEIRAGDFNIKSVQEMDKSLDALKAKVTSAVPVERGFRTEAGKFAEDLKNSTKMFDAATIDYAREILVDTKDHEATTVAELVAFMLKYRLQFASAERSPDASELYTKLYDTLRQQHTAFGIKLPDALPPQALAQDHDAVKPVPRDANWMKRHDSMNERVKKGNVDLLFIGDSITKGWEDAGSAVWSEKYAKRNAVNLGIGGDRTQHVLWRLDNGSIEGIKPKLAVIMIGTNNSDSNTSEQIAEGITAIVKKLRGNLPETKILLLGIFPRGAVNENKNRRVNMKANVIVAKLADGTTVEYLDIGPKFLDGKGVLRKEVTPDLLHLTPVGYQTWADAIEPHVARMMGESK